MTSISSRIRIITAVAGAALFLAASGAAVSAPMPQEQPATQQRQASTQEPLTRADVERIIAERGLVTKAELAKYATKADIEEIRVALERLLAQVRAIRARLNGGDVTPAPPAAPSQPERQP
jgi:hypothetical protein